MYEANFAWGVTVPWIVINSTHWIYQGTGLSDGDTIPNLVGYEYNKVYNNGQTPAGTQILSNSPVSNFGQSSTQNATLYTAKSGALVFDAGTVAWDWRLDTNPLNTKSGADSRVQQMTSNIFNRMLAIIPPTPAPTPTTSPTQPLSYSIFDDTLQNNWTLPAGTYHASVNANVSSPVYSGTNATSFSLTGSWGEIDYRNPVSQSISGYATVHFAAQADQSTSKLQVAFYNGGVQVGTAVPLLSYGGQPVQGSWKIYDIPLSAFNLNGGSITDLIIQDQTGQASGITYYLDEVGFGSSASTAAAPPTPTIVPTETSTPTPTSKPQLTVYNDSLSLGWTNYLYNATINLAETSPVFSGIHSSSFTLTAHWGEIDFHTNGVNITPFTVLHFAVQAGQATSNLDVQLRTTAGGYIYGSLLSLSGLGGNPVPGKWMVYNIPLSSLIGTLDPTTINDIIIQDKTGQSQGIEYYIDEVYFH
jgi:hypothetical protein